MQKKISIVIFSNHKTRIHSLSISTKRMMGSVCFLAAVFTGMIAIFFDYGNLKETRLYSFKMQHKLSLQQEEIARQRSEIQFFANAIDQLKSNLMAFNQYKRKIRIIANLEAGPQTTGLFGIGGPVSDDRQVSLPADPNPAPLSLESTHSANRVKRLP